MNLCWLSNGVLQGPKVGEQGTTGPFRRSVIAVEEALQQQPQQGDSLAQQAAVHGNNSSASYLRPPVHPAESGNDFITTQPFQLLSWYPRYRLACLPLQ